MDQSDSTNNSLRLRYEAFSKFATNISQADSLQEICEDVGKHLKFIVDVFAFRFTLVLEQQTYVLELFQGECTFDSQSTISEFEYQCLKKRLPLTLSQEDIQREDLLHNSLLNHPRVTQLMVLPVKASENQSAVLLLATKNKKNYSEVDFRFARLIYDVLSTKISQQVLIQTIADSNLSLLQANQQLAQLNWEVQTLNSALENKVEERTARLQEALGELHTLLYRTSHDFRRPITTILGLSELFTMSQSSEETATLVQHLKSTVTGLDNMTVKLQALMLPKSHEPPGTINFSQLIEFTRLKFQDKLSKEAIHFSYEVNQQNDYFSYASVHQAVLENLIENAIQYHGTNNPFVRLQVEEKTDSLIIQVIDNGEGIRKNLHAAIFGMYVRASDRNAGNGLGLFIVKKLVDALGGSISLTSAKHKGSSFSIKLPFEKGYSQHQLSHPTTAFS